MVIDSKVSERSVVGMASKLTSKVAEPSKTYWSPPRTRTLTVLYYVLIYAFIVLKMHNNAYLTYTCTYIHIITHITHVINT